MNYLLYIHVCARSSDFLLCNWMCIIQIVWFEALPPTDLVSIAQSVTMFALFNWLQHVVYFPHALIKHWVSRYPQATKTPDITIIGKESKNCFFFSFCLIERNLILLQYVCWGFSWFIGQCRPTRWQLLVQLQLEYFPPPMMGYRIDRQKYNCTYLSTDVMYVHPKSFQTKIWLGDCYGTITVLIITHSSMLK